MLGLLLLPVGSQWPDKDTPVSSLPLASSPLPLVLQWPHLHQYRSPLHPSEWDQQAAAPLQELLRLRLRVLSSSRLTLYAPFTCNSDVSSSLPVQAV
jgi:hypothetical protein